MPDLTVSATIDGFMTAANAAAACTAISAAHLGSANAFTGVITVPNGTAAAPGLRLTSEASGLYRVSATSLGFSVAGSGVATLTSGQIFTVGLGSGAVDAAINLNGTAGQTRQFIFQSAGVARWAIRCDNTAESGADAGSAFVISARTDAGALIDLPLSIVRASGGAITLARPVSCTNTTASTSTTTGALTCAGGGAFAKELVTGLGLWLVDGQTAPSSTSGYAKIYVDTADGDLKIIFGDGTIKTIVTDA